MTVKMTVWMEIGMKMGMETGLKAERKVERKVEKKVEMRIKAEVRAEMAGKGDIGDTDKEGSSESGFLNVRSFTQWCFYKQSLRHLRLVRPPRPELEKQLDKPSLAAFLLH